MWQDYCEAYILALLAFHADGATQTLHEAVSDIKPQPVTRNHIAIAVAVDVLKRRVTVEQLLTILLTQARASVVDSDFKPVVDFPAADVDTSAYRRIFQRIGGQIRQYLVDA